MQAIVGSIKASAVAQTHAPVYDAQFNYIKDALGGYGLYYSAAISGMGLSLPATPAAGLPYDAPTPEGRAVAAAFRAAVADTVYYRDYFDDDNARVPADVVLEYIRAACLCQLQTDTAPDRPLLQDVFLHAGGTADAEQRRSTMRMFLDLADQTAGHELTQDRFRRLIYYRSTGSGASWTPAEPNVRTARRWRLYQAREYYSYGLNRLWRYLAEWGNAQVQTSGDVLPIATWWAHVDDALDFTTLAGTLGVENPGLDRDLDRRRTLSVGRNHRPRRRQPRRPVGHDRTRHRAHPVPVGRQRRHQPSGHPRRAQRPRHGRRPGWEPNDGARPRQATGTSAATVACPASRSAGSSTNGGTGRT